MAYTVSTGDVGALRAHNQGLVMELVDVRKERDAFRQELAYYRQKAAKYISITEEQGLMLMADHARRQPYSEAQPCHDTVQSHEESSVGSDLQIADGFEQSSSPSVENDQIDVKVETSRKKRSSNVSNIDDHNEHPSKRVRSLPVELLGFKGLSPDKSQCEDIKDHATTNGLAPNALETQTSESLYTQTSPLLHPHATPPINSPPTTLVLSPLIHLANDSKAPQCSVTADPRKAALKTFPSHPPAELPSSEGALPTEGEAPQSPITADPRKVVIKRPQTPPPAELPSQKEAPSTEDKVPYFSATADPRKRPQPRPRPLTQKLTLNQPTSKLQLKDRLDPHATAPEPLGANPHLPIRIVRPSFQIQPPPVWRDECENVVSLALRKLLGGPTGPGTTFGRAREGRTHIFLEADNCPSMPVQPGESAVVYTGFIEYASPEVTVFINKGGTKWEYGGEYRCSLLPMNPADLQWETTEFKKRFINKYLLEEQFRVRNARGAPDTRRGFSTSAKEILLHAIENGVKVG
ncbi:hypothetical protein DXG01_004360 [Tephrocybe rancida]|nr:hypothetical protein DXG01_004360 [Tephrocybe rancida]